MAECRVCNQDATNELKKAPLCDEHYRWAVEVFVAIKARRFSDLDELLEKLPMVTSNA